MNPIYKELVIKDDEKGLMSILFFLIFGAKQLGTSQVTTINFPFL
jgi:hypothetical protein